MRWIIGDIHGMRCPLEKLLARVKREDGAAQFLFVGDYVNRGPDSKGVIDLLLSMPDIRCIRGNHDDVFDLILNGKSYANHGSVSSPLVAFQWFMEHGLDKTLLSYGADERELRMCQRRPDRKLLRHLLSLVPESHRNFIHNLPAIIEFDDLFILHAWWPIDFSDTEPKLSVQLQKNASARQSSLWGRYSEADIYSPKAWTRTGFFGHTAVFNYSLAAVAGANLPIRGPKMVLLDTGAALAANGRLTAYCAETRTFLQVDREGNVVGE
jgi:serine/threonine protein phosphatase 1